MSTPCWIAGAPAFDKRFGKGNNAGWMTREDAPILGNGSGGQPAALVRNMGLFSLIVYGVGDMVGSGIYGTIGKASGQMGNAVWMSFAVSMVAALLTGLSYASLSSRYPRAAGAAYVTHRAFHLGFLSYVIGLTVCASGLTSMATNSNAFSKILAGELGWSARLGDFRLPIPTPWGEFALFEGNWGVAAVVVGFLLFMTFVNFRGIRESMWTNLLFTAVEVGGLLFVIFVGMKFWGSVDYFQTPQATELSSGLSLKTLFSSSVLTFFAFVGFEDMLNVAEEVKSPERTMPWGIVLALLTVTVLYIAISLTCVSVVPYDVLSNAAVPLGEVTDRAAPWLNKSVYDVITMFAVANSVLINYIMGSRLLYGMSRQGMMPRILGRVHSVRRTPHVAIGALLCIVIVLCMAGGIADLAAATGMLLLTSFCVVNGALVVLKLRKTEPPGRFEIPIFVPILGILVNATLVYSKLSDPKSGQRSSIIAISLIAFIALLYFVLRPKNITEETLAAADEA